jgi:F0F1-type ATP synthase assembly protein I
MSQTNDPSNKQRTDYPALGTQALTVGGEVGCLTLVIVLASVFGGIWLDKVFGTKPLVMILLVIASAPLALGLTFWIAKRETKRYYPSSPTLKDNKPSEGDTTGE